MDLSFDGFEVIVLFVAVLLGMFIFPSRQTVLTISPIVNYLIGDGKSHWLEGVLLMTLYLIIAVAAWLDFPEPVTIYCHRYILIMLGFSQMMHRK